MIQKVDSCMPRKAVSRILLLTNHFYEWGGSELIITELAEEFARRGLSATIFANHFNEKFANKIESPSIHFERVKENINLRQYDLVYCQHQVLSFFLEQLIDMAGANGPHIFYGHLSPYEKLEFPGPWIEKSFGDLFLCNSLETMEKMETLGLDVERLLLMPNPAPDSFFEIASAEGGLKRLLVVSNHVPSELEQSFRLLRRRGIRTTLYGISGKYERVTPKVMEGYDAVVSIGKTVQYSLAAKRPVYVYDQFGGPGWITHENFEQSARFNFSGRCTNRRMSAHKIVDELVSGFDRALHDVNDLSSEVERFRLSSWLDGALLRVHSCRSPERGEILSRGEDFVQGLWREFHLFSANIQNRKDAVEITHNSLCIRYAAYLVRLVRALKP